MTMNWRLKTEQKFEQLADFIFENSKKTILAVLLVVVGLSSNLSTLKMDTSTEGFLHITKTITQSTTHYIILTSLRRLHRVQLTT